MLFKVNIKNLGKLTEADIRIGKFTVFAGPNNTGKTFVSKALYSIFGAMNANHLDVSIGPVIKRLRGVLRHIERADTFVSNSDSLQQMVLSVENLRDSISNVSVDADRDEFTAIQQALPAIFHHIDSISNIFPRLQEEAMEFINEPNFDEDEDPRFYMFDEDAVTEMEKCIKTLYEYKDQDERDFIAEGLNREATNNFLQNFQVTKLSSLYNNEGNMSFDIPDISNIRTHNGRAIFEGYKAAGLHLLQKYSRVLYFESPVFWKIRPPLDMVRKAPRFFFSNRTELPNVPKYVYDMYDTIDHKYSGDAICPDFLARLTSKDVLGGKIVVSETDGLVFQEEKTATPLSLAATGVVHLGMLAFFIEHNLLDKNTFLFIDEPEAHLHPAWQVEMVEALYALSKAGVNVIIATHSADIMKWMEVHVNEHKDAEDNIEVNHFRRDGIVSSNGESITKRINIIQNELADPFFRLYYRGL